MLYAPNNGMQATAHPLRFTAAPDAPPGGFDKLRNVVPSKKQLRELRVKDLCRIPLLILGTLCVALGVVGMFLPVLPTTPFLLLAAICYGRSSERFYRWLMTNRWCGKYIRNYREGKGLPLRQKVLTILLMWLTIGSTVWLAVSSLWLRLILLGIAIGITIHLVKIKTYKPEMQHSQPFKNAADAMNLSDFGGK